MNEMSVHVTENLFSFNGSFPLQTIKEGDTFITFCPLLDDISGYGNTFEIARKRFTEALLGTLLILHHENKLEEFLESCGWQAEKIDDKYSITPPITISINDDYKPEEFIENAENQPNQNFALC